MIKKIISLGVLLVIALSVAACGNTTDWQSRLDELNEKIDRQTERISELEEENAKQAEKILELEEELKNILENDVIEERWDEDWNYNMWYGKIEVSVILPRVVEQGSSFSITITTTNISEDDFEYTSSCSCCADKGVKIVEVRQHKSDDSFRMKGIFRPHNCEAWDVIIPKGQSVTYTWLLEATHFVFEPFYGYLEEDAPKGKYDIYLENGEVFRNAIIVV